jgi:hypothetical protein
MALKLLYLDFEFKNTNEQAYDIVCCCTRTNEGQEMSYWLYQDIFAQALFLEDIRARVSDGYVLVAWVAAAELRSLLSLNCEIDDIPVIDAQVEFKLYANTESFQRWIQEANTKLTADARLKGKSYPQLQATYSLAVAYALLFHQRYDEKEDMRRLIVGAPTFTKEEQTLILEYCMKDTRITQNVLQKTSRYLVARFPQLKTTYVKQALKRGEYVKASTWVEWFGYPIDQEMLEKVGRNLDVIEKSFVTEECQDIQDLWIRTVQAKKGSYEEFSFNNAILAEKIQKLDLGHIWPKTDGKRPQYKTDIETLKELSAYHPFINALHSVKRKMACIKYLTLEEKDKDVLARKKLRTAISSQGRIHCWLNPYGTTTGRNAPPARTFVFAQSSWQRVLVRPKPGRVIIGLDYRAQEILIAGIVGKDSEFLKGYAKDPYISFALAGGFIPYPDSELPLGELKKKYAQFRSNVLKAVVLGMNYGMGVPKLAKRLGMSESEARPFYRGHKQVYREYWKDAEEFTRRMKRTGEYFELWQDWGIYENGRYGTLVNWRIQGWGGAVLRELSIRLTHKAFRERGIQLICLLHDAVYVEVDEAIALEVAKEVEGLMQQVFYDLLPSKTCVEVEWKIHRPDEFWIETKAEGTWEIIKPFIVN